MAASRKLLRIKQAVDYMNGVVTEKTLRDWIWRRKIEVVRVGRCVCVSQDALDAVIQRGTRFQLLTIASKRKAPVRAQAWK
jgi:excisionase family DNA binding protein